MTVGFLLLGFVVPAGARAQSPQGAPPEEPSAAFGRSRETGVLSVSFTAAGNANASNGFPTTATSGVGGGISTGSSAIPDLTNSSSLAGIASFQGFRVHSEARASFKYDPSPKGRFSWQFGGSSGLRKYDTKGFLPIGHSVYAGGNLGLGNRTTLSVSESFTYTPNYRLMPEPAATDADPAVQAADASQLSAELDYSLSHNPLYSLSTMASVKHAFAEHSTVTLTYTNQRSRFLNGIGPGLDLQNLRGQFRQQLTSWATLHMGYGRREGRYGLAVGARPASVDDIDFGIDNSRQVTFGRRTTLAFSSGSALAGQGGRRLYLTGRATLAYALLRRTQVSVGVNRSLRMQIGLTTPSITTGFTATLTSDPSRALKIVATSTMSTSEQVGGSGAASRFRSATTSARVVWMARRSVDAYAQYLYSSHDAGSAVELMSGVPQQRSRQAVMIGVTMTIRKALLHSRR